IAHKADLAIRDREGYAALDSAVAYGWIESAKVLLSNGASVDAHDRSGRTALVIAIASNQVAAAELLIKAGSYVDVRGPMGITPIFAAALKGQPKAVRLLLEHNADAKAVTAAGLTTLMAAAIYPSSPAAKRFGVGAIDVDVAGKVECAQLLIDAGVDVNARTKSGVTALRLASGHPELIALLKSREAR
ncbi:MAG TPA: ankyrin repeat domain-containing protein, partial [Chthonomonadaceae bacterium]|nr:ankyrin repeat domain-containing protein [Chthonomonadaceae bacterium]